MRIKSNRFRFSLRTLFIAVAFFSLLLAWQMKVVRDRHAMRVEITRRGALIGSAANAGKVLSSPLVAVRQLFGDEPIASINLHPDSFTEQDFEKVQKMFPEADLTQRNILEGGGAISPLERQERYERKISPAK